jgi:hypothetical protein
MEETKWVTLYERIDPAGNKIEKKHYNKYYTINITLHENEESKIRKYVRHCRKREHNLIGDYAI